MQKDTFTKAIEPILLKHHIPGATVAIRINGDRFFESGVGYQEADYTIPITSDANFYIYSVTKTLLATVTMNLVGKRVLDLDCSVQSYLPNFPLDAAITLRHLLSHTSGLPDYGGIVSYSDAVKFTPTQPWSSQEFLNLIQTEGLRFAPGTDWAYSNIGYVVLRCILDCITGLSIQQLLDQIIFSPLELRKTFVPGTLEDVTVLTPGYTQFFGGTELQDMSSLYHPGWVSHGVVISTAPELAKIIDGLFHNRILSAELVNRMRSPIHIFGKFPMFEQFAYGLGLFLDVEPNISGHTGEGPGYSVAAFHFPDLVGHQTTIVAMANRDKSDFGLIMVYKLAEVLRNHLSEFA
ncbi:serine hydrolase domain-containing protein [Leptolyngbya sp. NIES-2104]|uniref:serine hydrolase domain-containing protein n=1 Tax=Leptolyngbya sp. NIES-2104 TaxID=1552121 RepID=UPI0006EC9C48|nr:serine hydrolase domain-containing protein [Leptolyngbya sp. NIES-2104]GAP96291.1 beta-lactamase [Leptolyngbya sp. NIES-2104]